MGEGGTQENFGVGEGGTQENFGWTQKNFGSRSQEVEKIALAISDSRPGEAKSVIRIAFLALSAEQKRGSRQFLGEDRGGNSRPKLPREGG